MKRLTLWVVALLVIGLIVAGALSAVSARKAGQQALAVSSAAAGPGRV